MSRYLEEAAQLLRKAAESTEHRDRMESTRHVRRLEIADAFTRLAAIEKGLLPLDMLPEILKRAEEAR